VLIGLGELTGTPAAPGYAVVHLGSWGFLLRSGVGGENTV